MRPVLVKVDVAARELGLAPKRIMEMAQGGTLTEGSLIWVFNLARADARRIDYRFWLGELMCKANNVPFPTRTLDEAMNCICPPSVANWHAGRIIEEFQFRDSTLLRVREEIGQPLGMIPREKLVTWLKQRWLGAAPELAAFSTSTQNAL